MGGGVEHPTQDLALAVDQVERRAVVDGVGHGGVRRLDLAPYHAVTPRQFLQPGLAAGGADEALAEEGQVLLQPRQGVALRVHRDHQRYHPLTLVGRKLGQRLAHHRQAHGTDVGTVGVAEEHHRHLLLAECLQAKLALGGGQRDRSADGLPDTLVTAELLLVPTGSAHRQQQHDQGDPRPDSLASHGAPLSTVKSNPEPSLPSAVSTMTRARQGITASVQMGICPSPR